LQIAFRYTKSCSQSVLLKHFKITRDDHKLFDVMSLSLWKRLLFMTTVKIMKPTDLLKQHVKVELFLSGTSYKAVTYSHALFLTI